MGALALRPGFFVGFWKPNLFYPKIMEFIPKNMEIPNVKMEKRGCERRGVACLAACVV